MKNVTLLMSFGLLLLSSCSTEELTPTTSNLEESIPSYFVTSVSTNEGNVLETILFDPQETGLVSAIERGSGNSAHTHGEYSMGGDSITFSGTENGGGIHGSAVYKTSNGTSSAHVILETICVWIDPINTNEAIYAGVITEVIENTFPPVVFPPPGPTLEIYQLDDKIYFKVIDNGQGDNALPDEHQGVVFATINGSTFPSCGVSLPWYLGTRTDVNAPGLIKVND